MTVAVGILYVASLKSLLENSAVLTSKPKSDRSQVYEVPKHGPVSLVKQSLSRNIRKSIFENQFITIRSADVRRS